MKALERERGKQRPDPVLKKIKKSREFAFFLSLLDNVHRVSFRCGENIYIYMYTALLLNTHLLNICMCVSNLG